MKLYIVILALSFIILQNISFSQFTNVQIFPSSHVQIEPSIVKHPTNSQILFASAYTLIGIQKAEGVYVSTNGGLNWFGTDQCPGTPVQNHGGDPGPIIDKNGVFILTHQGESFPGMYSNTSNDNGTNWTPSIQISSGNQEKGSPATDDISTSPYFGNSYLAWQKFQAPFPIVFAYTTNSASSWSSIIQVNNSLANHSSYGPVMAIGPAGQIYLSWASTIQVSPLNEDFIGFGVSTNGGLNWTVQESAYDCNGIKAGVFSPAGTSWAVRVNGYPEMDVDLSGGPRNGWIYIVTGEKDLAPAGSDADVIFHRSTNGGATWSPGIRVNTDPLNNGAAQFYPIMSVDQGGGINVVYYDNRNGPDSAEVYLARSTNGGSNWTEYKVSNHKFRPRAAVGTGGGIWGDNIGMTVVGNKLYPVWMDDYGSSPGLYQVWTAIIDLNTIGVYQISTEIPSAFGLKQNYPNPFNPSTKISFDIPQGISSAVSLKIFESSGREVKSLFEGSLKPGTYETSWDADGFATGVYFYRLTADNFSQTKKMVLVK